MRLRARGLRLMELNKLGFAVGVLALVLAVPLAVLANLLTPRVRDWYSTTALKRLEKRILELRATLTRSEGTWTFTPGEWEIYETAFRRTQSSTFAFASVFYLVAGAAMMALFFYEASGGTIRPRTLPPLHRGTVHFMFLFACFGFTFTTVALLSATRRYRHNYNLHSDDGREYL